MVFRNSFSPAFSAVSGYFQNMAHRHKTPAHSFRILQFFYFIIGKFKNGPALKTYHVIMMLSAGFRLKSAPFRHTLAQPYVF